jgi:Ca-activated chloride channel family protein
MLEGGPRLIPTVDDSIPLEVRVTDDQPPASWTDRLEPLNRRLDRWPVPWRKPIWFGLWGGVGCLLGALLLGEPLLLLLMPGPPARPQVDVLFVLDVTGSMQFAIDGVRDGIRSFADGLGRKELDSRIGLVAFQDRQLGELPQVLRFDGRPLTPDIAAFRERVATLYADGGGDAPETCLDALKVAADQPFRPEATKVLVLITDAPPKIPDGPFHSVEDAANALEHGGIAQAHLVIPDNLRAVFTPLQRTLKGQVFSIDEAAGRRGGFDAILPELGREIAEETIRGLQSGTEVGRSAFWPLIGAIAVWTAVLAAGLALALIVGQNGYLKREPLSLAEGLPGGLGGLAAGLVAGAAGQFLYQLVPFRPFQVLGWTLLGALVGAGMASFVPNLDRRRALVGGAIGGALGCVGYLLASSAVGDVVGRLLGSALLGGCIGVMVGLVEVAFRDAWLEVAYGPEGKEKRAVSLGREPVAVGSDRTCKVWARDAAPVAYRYKFEAGRVQCEDVEGRRVEVVSHGDRRTVGKLSVTVCLSGSAAASTTPRAEPVSVSPRPKEPGPVRPASAAPPVRATSPPPRPAPSSRPAGVASPPVAPSPPPSVARPPASGPGPSARPAAPPPGPAKRPAAPPPPPGGSPRTDRPSGPGSKPGGS